MSVRLRRCYEISKINWLAVFLERWRFNRKKEQWSFVTGSSGVRKKAEGVGRNIHSFRRAWGRTGTINEGLEIREASDSIVNSKVKKLSKDAMKLIGELKAIVSLVCTPDSPKKNSKSYASDEQMADVETGDKNKDSGSKTTKNVQFVCVRVGSQSPWGYQLGRIDLPS